MRRSINNMIIVAGLLCAGFSSCSQDENVQSPDSTYDQVFTGLLTRADASGNPEHGDTYRIMAYAKTGNYQIPNANQSGSYAYDLNEDYSVGSIVPVAVSTTTYETTLSGGKLVKAGANGLHLTAGDYYVSMIHPCVPVYHASGLGYLAVFNRNDKIYASQPLDKGGDSSQKPFEINVSTNRLYQNVNGVVMHPLMSKIGVYFYSCYYAETDVDRNTPLSIDFSVDEIKLVNAGVNGWYNPMLDIVYPNYNYKTKTVYSKEVLTNTPTDNEESLTATSSSATFNDKYGDPVTAEWEVADISVFPSDYSNSSYANPMILRVKLKDSNNLFNKASIPVSFEVERNKLYKFYINVTSEQIQISYTVGAWNPQSDTYTSIGDPMDYATIELSRNNSEWNPNNTSQEIDGDE